MMKKFKYNWQIFLSILFNPWILMLIVSTCILVYISSEKTDQFTASIINILLVISSSLMGAMLVQQWSKLSEEKVTVARGMTAVRSLKVLLNDLNTYEKRLLSIHNRIQNEEMDSKLFNAFLEEYIVKFKGLQEFVVSSIENWTDIIPEADIKTQIGLINQINQDKSKLSNELNELKQELEDNKIKTEDFIQLKNDLNKKIKELDKIKQKEVFNSSNILMDINTNYDTSNLFAKNYNNSNIENSFTIQRTKNFESLYNSDYLSNLLKTPSINNEYICFTCKNKKDILEFDEKGRCKDCQKSYVGSL